MPIHMMITGGAVLVCLLVLAGGLAAEAWGYWTYTKGNDFSMKTMSITMIFLLAFVLSLVIALHNQSGGSKPPQK